MQRTLLPLFLILLTYSGWTSGLCLLENGTIAQCHELEDVKYIVTYDLETLQAPLHKSVLGPGYFTNLTTLRHLDLSGGTIERIQPGSFNKLTNLRSLNLADNRIEHLELGSLDNLNHLHSLNLRKNNLRHLSPAMARLKVLKHLDVEGNPLECNCATLRVRDLIVKRGVKFSKKTLCVSPSNVRGTSLFKLDATIICNFEEQDREMQNDQSYDTSDGLDNFGSGDLFDKDDDSDDYVDLANNSTEVPQELEIETPFPKVSDVSTVPSIPESKPTESLPETSNTVEDTGVSNNLTDSDTKTTVKNEEIFFDSEEKEPTVATTLRNRKVYKDDLFYPVEGSGDGDEGSGEGSGVGYIIGDRMNFDRTEETNDKTQESSLGNELLDMFLGVFWSSTAAPKILEPGTEDPDLEEEQFIDASSTKEAEEEETVSQKVELEETVPTTEIDPRSNLVLISDKDDKLAENELSSEEMSEVSPAKQSKKGMGSYIVLAALLAILVTLIGFAAYKSEFCRKKRKRGDVENGTELKDMQKALLETGNSTQPKIASNGNVESAPLVEDAIDHEELKDSRHCQVTADVPKPANGTSDPTNQVKSRSTTPRNDVKARMAASQDENSLKDDSLSLRTNSIEPAVNNSSIARLPEVGGPPLSPGAQRVKITLQENPDSVPRTPILITRTTAGENLVKVP